MAPVDEDVLLSFLESDLEEELGSGQEGLHAAPDEDREILRATHNGHMAHGRTDHRVRLAAEVGHLDRCTDVEIAGR